MLRPDRTHMHRNCAMKVEAGAATLPNLPALKDVSNEIPRFSWESGWPWNHPHCLRDSDFTCCFEGWNLLLSTFTAFWDGQWNETKMAAHQRSAGTLWYKLLGRQPHMQDRAVWKSARKFNNLRKLCSNHVKPMPMRTPLLFTTVVSFRRAQWATLRHGPSQLA